MNFRKVRPCLSFLLLGWGRVHPVLWFPSDHYSLWGEESPGPRGHALRASIFPFLEPHPWYLAFSTQRSWGLPLRARLHWPTLASVHRPRTMMACSEHAWTGLEQLRIACAGGEAPVVVDMELWVGTGRKGLGTFTGILMLHNF